MISKITKKMSGLSIKDWLVLSLWILTLISLLVFVVLAATMEHTALQSETIKEHIVTSDPGKITDSENNTVLIKTLGVTDDGITSWSISDYQINVLKNAHRYAMALATSGLIFATFLFGALITTVIFAYNKKKGGK